jgi:CBS domain-containing protein
MVFDYVAGKLDWLSNALPVEGTLAETATLGKLAHPDVPTCHPTERLSQVRSRLDETGWKICVVINDARVVLGVVHNENQPAQGEDAMVDLIMELGPTTFRPHLTPNEIADHIERKKPEAVLVTTSDGRLFGAVPIEDLYRNK